MPVQTVVNTVAGRVIQGISYRMAAYQTPPPASIPASPYPFVGGVYHLETALGWVDIPMSDVHNITLYPSTHS
jgi:hypothetical protein